MLSVNEGSVAPFLREIIEPCVKAFTASIFVLEIWTFKRVVTVVLYKNPPSPLEVIVSAFNPLKTM
jgi:hypothetical protein